jgi:cell division protein ZapA
MPEVTLEIGERMFEVVCEPGEEASLERAARLLDTEATRLTAAVGKSTEKRMLLLAGLMLADTTSALEDRLRETEARLKAAEERIRITEAKAAMLAANALKLETEADHRAMPADMSKLREEHAEALDLLERVLAEVSAMAEAAEAGSLA